MADKIDRPTILIIGASRGLGYAMAEEFLERGWDVVGTVRNRTADTPFSRLAALHPERVETEIVDICFPQQIEDLKGRLAQRRFEILFVNAGTTNPDPTQAIGEVSTKDFVDLMVTNALSPMRLVEVLVGQVTEEGMIGIMSSGQGSIANNVAGQRELYRGTKAALNMFMRSFAARQKDSLRTLVLMAPGWVQTDLGGSDAPLTIQDSVPNLVNVLIEYQGKRGLHYVDYLGRTVPW